MRFKNGIGSGFMIQLKFSRSNTLSADIHHSVCISSYIVLGLAPTIATAWMVVLHVSVCVCMYVRMYLIL